MRPHRVSFPVLRLNILKNGKFENLEQVRSEIFSYIEGYCNQVRLHSILDCKSPLEFEKELKTGVKSKKKEERELCVSLNLTVLCIEGHTKHQAKELTF